MANSLQSWGTSGSNSLQSWNQTTNQQALRRVGLHYITSKSLEDVLDYIQIKEADDKIYSAGRPLSWIWSTYEGSKSQKQFRLDIRYKGWMRDVSYETNWTSTRQITLEAANCNEQEKSGMFYWSHSLDIGGMFQEISGGKWSYANRTYDRLIMEITVTAIHTDWYVEKTERESDTVATTQVIIDYIPSYFLTSMVQETSEIVALNYTTTWGRKNDRFNISALEVQQAGQWVNALAQGSYSSHVAGAGRIEIPTWVLSRHIAKHQVRVGVDFNAEYRVSGDHLDEVTGTFKVSDLSECNAVRQTINEKDGVIYINTAELISGKAALKQVTIKLVGGEYAFDQQTVPIGQTAVFPYCPFNKELVFQAVGAGQTSTSPISTAKHPGIKGDKYRLDAMNTGDFEYLMWRASDDDAGIQVTARPNSEVVDLARGYPTAFYGEGARKDISYNCVLIDDEGHHIEQMATSGPLLLRSKDKRRYAIDGEVRISRPSERITRISISGQVISG